MRVKQPLDEDQRKRLPEIIRHALEEAIPDCLTRFFSSVPSSMPRAEVDSGYVSVEPEPSEVGQPSTERYTPNYSVPNVDKGSPFTGKKGNQIVDYTPSHISGASNSHDCSNDATSVVNVTECFVDFSTLLYPQEPWEVLPPESTGATESASNLRQFQGSSQQVDISQFRNPHAGSSFTVPSIIINPTEQVGENTGLWNPFEFFEYSAVGRDNMSQLIGAVSEQQVIGNGEPGVGRGNQNWNAHGQ
jgi:hypothetical protein